VTNWVLIVGCGVVLALPLAWRLARRTFDPFEPIVLFALAYGAMFVARPASVLTQDETRFWGVDILPTLPRALVLALVGAVAFVVGYEVRLGRGLGARIPAPPPVDTRIAAAATLILAGLATVALAVFLPTSEGPEALRLLLRGRSGEFGALLKGSSTYVWYGSLLFAPAAFVLIGLTMRARTPLLAAAAAGVSTLALVRLVPVGTRIALLPLLGGVFVLAYVMQDRRPRALTLGALAAVALLVSFFTLDLRDPTDDLTVSSAAHELGDRPQAVFDPVLRGADAEMVLALSAALTVVPDELPHRWGGATVGDLVTRPIPRELWAGKPLPPGEKVVSTVWPQYYPALDPAFSPLLVFYWDFGLPGVALGMALFGVLARCFYEWLLRHRGRFGAQLIFSMGLWFVVIAARNDPVDTIVFASFLVLPVVAVVIVASETRLPARLTARRVRSEMPARTRVRIPR
jgi:hypothetical protein